MMGFGSYLLPDGREAGYNIVAECDHPDCHVEIDRGLSYLCGQNPDGHRDDHEPGCGRYYCWENNHLSDHDCPNPDGRCEWCDDGFVEDLDNEGAVIRCPECSPPDGSYPKSDDAS